MPILFWGFLIIIMSQKTQHPILIIKPPYIGVSPCKPSFLILVTMGWLFGPKVHIL